MTTQSKPKAPTGLGTAGKRLWRSITGEYELAAHERALLESACREADLIARLESAAQNEPLTVKGSMGQTVASPYVSELRQHRATQASLLRALKLPDHDSDDNDEKVVPMTKSEAGKKGSRARWGHRYGS